MSMPMKSRPILLDMTATCGAADLPSPTHLGGGEGGMTTLDYGVCEVMPTDPDWRHTPATIHRPSYNHTRSTSVVAVDCYGDPASAGRTTKWDVDEDVEFDSRVCWAAYHHHVPVGGDIAPSGDGQTVSSSPTTSSFRPSVRTTASVPAAIARTHVYEMPQFQSWRQLLWTSMAVSQRHGSVHEKILMFRAICQSAQFRNRACAIKYQFV